MIYIFFFFHFISFQCNTTSDVTRGNRKSILSIIFGCIGQVQTPNKYSHHFEIFLELRTQKNLSPFQHATLNQALSVRLSHTKFYSSFQNFCHEHKNSGPFSVFCASQIFSLATPNTTTNTTFTPPPFFLLS